MYSKVLLENVTISEGSKSDSSGRAFPLNITSLHSTPATTSPSRTQHQNYFAQPLSHSIACACTTALLQARASLAPTPLICEHRHCLLHLRCLPPQPQSSPHLFNFQSPLTPPSRPQSCAFPGSPRDFWCCLTAKSLSAPPTKEQEQRRRGGRATLIVQLPTAERLLGF
jgi:hypothetical protein